MADVPWKIDDTQSDAVPWKIDDTKPTPTRTIGEEAQRQAGITGRNILSAVTSPVHVGASVLNKAINALSGRQVFDPNPSARFEQSLTDLGFPEPTTGVEKFGQGMAQSAPAFALPGTLPAQVAGNALMGAAQSEPGEELKSAAIGGTVGAGGHVLSKALGGIVTPTKDARVLMDRGVALTPGQAGGAGSFAKRTEEQLASLPIASHYIRGAQKRAVEEGNVAAAQAVSNMVDKNVKLGLPPREAIEQTRDLISKTYTESLDGMTVPGVVTEAFMRNTSMGIKQAHPLIPAKEVRTMENFIGQRVGDLTQNSGGTLTGAQLKQLDSEIGTHIRNLRTSTNASDKTAAPAWQDLQQTLRDLMDVAQGDPAKSAQLQAANAAYRQLLALEKSLLPGSANFTPRQLQRQLDKAKITNTELNTVADSMGRTLPNTVPDSGTAERVIMATLPSLLMGGGYGAQEMGLDTLGAGAIAAGALGTRAGSKFLTGGYPGQAMLSAALRRATPATAHAMNRKDKR